METKLAKLKQHMAAGEYRQAIKLAASFQQLGDHKAPITRAWAAIQNPDFYRSIGKNIAMCEAEGIRAICDRYELPIPKAYQWIAG